MENLRIKINKLFCLDRWWGRGLFIIIVYFLYWIIVYATPLLYIGGSVSFFEFTNYFFTNLLFNSEELSFSIIEAFSWYADYLFSLSSPFAFWYFFVLAPLLILLPSKILRVVLPQNKYINIYSLVVVLATITYISAYMVSLAVKNGFNF